MDVITFNKHSSYLLKKKLCFFYSFLGIYRFEESEGEKKLLEGFFIRQMERSVTIHIPDSEQNRY